MVLIRHFKLKLNPPLDGTGRRCQMIKRLVCVGLLFTWQDKGALLVPWIVAVTCTTALDFVYAIYLIIFVVNKRPLVWLQLHFPNFQSFQMTWHSNSCDLKDFELSRLFTAPLIRQVASADERGPLMSAPFLSDELWRSGSTAFASDLHNEKVELKTKTVSSNNLKRWSRWSECRGQRSTDTADRLSLTGIRTNDGARKV